jgi:hypothetical protein
MSNKTPHTINEKENIRVYGLGNGKWQNNGGLNQLVQDAPTSHLPDSFLGELVPTHHLENVAGKKHTNVKNITSQ